MKPPEIVPSTTPLAGDGFSSLTKAVYIVSSNIFQSELLAQHVNAHFDGSCRVVEDSSQITTVRLIVE